MIICRLSGGLGNQLFQYAAARRLSLIHNTELVLDLNWFKHVPRKSSVRVYELLHYPISARVASVEESRLLSRYHGRLAKFMPFAKPWQAYFENGIQFNSAVLNLPDNSYLCGYWQSYKYFEDVAKIIGNELITNEPLQEEDVKVMNSIVAAGSRSVAVHIRRADYVNLKSASDFHGVCSVDYYNSAFNILSEDIKSPHFFVFSDDMDWVRKNIIFPGDVTFVSHNSADTAFQDLRLITFCNHKVIANSSFSWWGAWLTANGGTSTGIVIAPRRWFAKSSISLQGRFPNSWILI